MKNKQTGIYKKLSKVLLIQLAIISVVTLLSVYGAAKVVENVLIKEALEGESRYYWAHLEKKPDFPLPNTLNLTGYLQKNESDVGHIPEAIRTLDLGYHKVVYGERHPLVHVSEKNGHVLYLLFEEGQVSRLAFYFGIAPLAFVLLMIYLPSWIGFMMAKRAISPIVKLSKRVGEIQVSSGKNLQLDVSDLKNSSDAEVNTLVESFDQFSTQVNNFVRREKNFTRYASHELRTPLAVLKGSIALLRKRGVSEDNVETLNRMESVLDEMRALIEGLLILARGDQEIHKEPVHLANLIDKSLEQLEAVHECSNLLIKRDYDELLVIDANETLLFTCVNNLINNAFNYTEQGSITITADQTQLVVSDTGVGIDSESLASVTKPFYRAHRDTNPVKGLGLGLTIVDKICNEMAWSFELESTKKKGTQAIIKFS